MLIKGEFLMVRYTNICPYAEENNDSYLYQGYSCKITKVRCYHFTEFFQCHAFCRELERERKEMRKTMRR